MTHMCNEIPVTVVNGQLPGPTIEVTEGDSVIVHVVNKSPYNITIHRYIYFVIFVPLLIILFLRYN
jgi:FtsP/CotA-like multicopper oxidase with cupredoxin domain